MSDLPVRRYNEKEVGRLLKRASELQRSSAATPNPGGLTLTELEDIAKEAGLDVSMLRQAANELDTVGTSNVGELFAGGPLRIVIERVLPFEASESSFAQLVAGIEAAMNGPGNLGQVGRTFTWHAARPNSGRTQQVRLSARDGQTTVRVEESYGGLLGGLYGGVLGGVGGGVGVGVGGAIGGALTGSVAVAVALPVTIFGITYWSVRAGFKRYVANRRRALENLMHDIVDVVTAQSSQQKLTS